MMKVFDGHNDVLARMWLSNAPDPVAAFLETGLPGHLDLKRCQAALLQVVFLHCLYHLSITYKSIILISSNIRSKRLLMQQRSVTL